jgi:nucleoside-diphosphate-sugar epimerase
MCRHFAEDFGLETGIACYHNVYGPKGTHDGGREKTCRWIYGQMAGVRAKRA